MVSREYLSHSDHAGKIKDMSMRVRENANLFQFIDSDKYYPFECAFDFEAMLKNIQVEDNEKKLKIVSEHIPVSVSLFSNVPDFANKPIFLCSDKPDELISEFLFSPDCYNYGPPTVNFLDWRDFLELRVP
jgi:hypothetical protein